MVGEVGTDCFPVNYCGTDNSSSTTTNGTSSNQPDESKPIQIFIDEDGYVWVAIISYQMDISGATFPHWIWLYRSLDPLSCTDVKDAGDAGFTPEGGSPGTVWYEYVCDGLAAGWDTYGTSGVCSDVAGEEPIIDPGTTDGPIITTFYRRRVRCCETSTDPCNVPDENDCPPAPDPDSECQECCDATTAPTWVACDINTITDIPTACQYCELINGTWLLYRETDACYWSTCRLLEICDGHTTEYKYVTVTLFLQANDNPAASLTFPCDWSVRISTSDTECPTGISGGIQIARFDTTPGNPMSTAPPIDTPCDDWNEEPLGLTAGGSAACSSNLGWVYITAVV